MWFKKNKVSTPLVEVLGALFDLDVFAIDETTMDLKCIKYIRLTYLFVLMMEMFRLALPKMRVLFWNPTGKSQ